MSLNIRYLTNGHKNVYVVRELSQTPAFVGFYENKADIDSRILYYVPDGEPVFCGPDQAWFFERHDAMKGLLDYLYPNHPKCVIPEHSNKRCVAESCRYNVFGGESSEQDDTSIDWTDIGGTRPKWCRWNGEDV